MPDEDTLKEVVVINPRVTADEGNEVVILENDPRPAGVAPQPGATPHPHHNHQVVLKAGLDEVVMPPTYHVGQSLRYKRTDRKTKDGLFIFQPVGA